MELVILSVAVARTATHAIDRFVPERPILEVIQGLVGSKRGEETEGAMSNEERELYESCQNETDGRPVTGNANGAHGNGNDTTKTEQENEFDDNSAEGLKRRIKQLRAEAARLTSADTFVEYARKTREATRLEKRLREEYGETGDEILGGGVDVDRMARAMKEAMTKRATLSARRSFSLQFVAKVMVKVLLLVALWFAFSYGRQSDSRGNVMYVDCRAVRPLSFFMRKKQVACTEDDWVCAARPRDECAVSYLVAVAVSNSVVALIVDGLLAKVVHQ